MRVHNSIISVLTTAFSVAFLTGCGEPGRQLPTQSSPDTVQPATLVDASLVLTPSGSTVGTGESIAFATPFAGPWAIQWSVNGIVGGNNSYGTINEFGTYSAPLLPVSGSVKITAALPDVSQDPSALSASAIVTVVNSRPNLDQLQPGNVLVGSSDLQLDLTGTGFNPKSQTNINGISVATTFIEYHSLSAIVPASFLVSAGTLDLNVLNPLPGGGASNHQSLTVLNPAPVLQAISPQSVAAGSTNILVNIKGNGFVPTSHILLGQQILVSNYVDSSNITVGVPDSDLANGGNLLFSVSNDLPGGGSSGTVALTVLNPVPATAHILPSGAFAGADPGPIQISGSGFVPSSTVNVGGQSLTTNYIDSNDISVDLPETLIASPTTLQLVVMNSGPGGGSSSPQNLLVLQNGQVEASGNPQVASYSLTLPQGSQASVSFGEGDYSFNTSQVAAPAGGGTARLLVAGMKGNTQYHMRAAVTLADGSAIQDTDHVFATSSLPSNMVPTVLIPFTSNSPSPGVQWFNNLDTVNGRVIVFATDLQGNIIWSYYHAGDPLLYQPAKILGDGNVWLGVLNGIRVVNLAGETVREISIDQVNSALTAAGYSFSLMSLHHDLQKLSNGHLILLGNMYRSIVLAGASNPTQVLGDVIVDLDPNLNVAWLWNSFDHLDVNRHPIDPSDWTHGNAIVPTPDGNLLFSMRNQSWVIKIDYQNGQGAGDILWKLGYQGDFSLAADSPSSWFYTQHYPVVLSEDSGAMRLAVFDDGTSRVLDNAGDVCGVAGQPACYSRAVIFDLNENSLSADIEFQNPLNDFTFWGGSIQQLANGNVLADLCASGPGARVMEMSDQNPSIPVWEEDVVGQNAYRALRYPSLYPGISWP